MVSFGGGAGNLDKRMPLGRPRRRNYTLPMLHTVPLFAREPRLHAGICDRRIAPTVTAVVSCRDLATDTPAILERRFGDGYLSVSLRCHQSGYSWLDQPLPMRRLLEPSKAQQPNRVLPN
jgi:hypothetical protein